jgi:hypothetical protein
MNVIYTDVHQMSTPDHEKKFLGAVDLLGPTGLTFIASSIGLHTPRLLTTGEAESHVVIHFYRFHNLV